MIALRKASRALTLGGIEFLDTPEPILAFVRRHEGQAVACVFNMSSAAAEAVHPLLKGGEMLPVSAGTAEPREGGLSLGPHACRLLKL